MGENNSGWVSAGGGDWACQAPAPMSPYQVFPHRLRQNGSCPEGAASSPILPPCSVSQEVMEATPSTGPPSPPPSPGAWPMEVSGRRLNGEERASL